MAIHATRFTRVHTHNTVDFEYVLTESRFSCIRHPDGTVSRLTAERTTGPDGVVTVASYWGWDTYRRRTHIFGGRGKGDRDRPSSGDATSNLSPIC